MGKRSKIIEANANPKDFWPTIDPDAIKRLVPFVYSSTYAEPCYGMGDLENHLSGVATCAWRSDVRETVGSSVVMDASDITEDLVRGCDWFITNPPFSWGLLKPLLDHLPTVLPTWMLLPADVMHNVRMGPYMRKCPQIISVGRLYWKDNKVKGVDNFCWYLFSDQEVLTAFTGR